MASKKKVQRKLTLRDRKKAQPDANLYFSEAERTAIVDTVAKKLDPAQRKVYFYQCQALGLNPLLNEITAIVYKGKEGSKMSIQVMRDGFLKIAHRSGLFAGMESGVKKDKDDESNIIGWAKVYHKNFQVPMYQEADFKEYDNSARNSLWKSKPKTMIKKVAESMALRKAFNVSGVYAPEEMEAEITAVAEPKVVAVDNPDKSASEEQKATIRALDKEKKTKSFDHLTRQEAADIIGKLSAKK
jgi:phage recombination protein Bet